MYFYITPKVYVINEEQVDDFFDKQEYSTPIPYVKSVGNKCHIGYYHAKTKLYEDKRISFENIVLERIEWTQKVEDSKSFQNTFTIYLSIGDDLNWELTATDKLQNCHISNSIYSHIFEHDYISVKNSNNQITGFRSRHTYLVIKRLFEYVIPLMEQIYTTNPECTFNVELLNFLLSFDFRDYENYCSFEDILDIIYGTELTKVCSNNHRGINETFSLSIKSRNYLTPYVLKLFELLLGVTPIYKDSFNRKAKEQLRNYLRKSMEKKHIDKSNDTYWLSVFPACEEIIEGIPVYYEYILNLPHTPIEFEQLLLKMYIGAHYLYNNMSQAKYYLTNIIDKVHKDKYCNATLSPYYSSFFELMCKMQATHKIHGESRVGRDDHEWEVWSITIPNSKNISYMKQIIEEIESVLNIHFTFNGENESFTYSHTEFDRVPWRGRNKDMGSDDYRKEIFNKLAVYIAKQVLETEIPNERVRQASLVV